MAMTVQHNLTAMNSNRQLGVTTSTQAKSTEKLSSGFKINRAADDAAGLAISEKMRRQIRGLTQASSNAQDGISSVQTAEGALTEVHDMLQRMDELATKAANGTMSENDRQNIQDEVDQLLTEVDRVAETTKFNEIYLLKGNAEGTESSKLVNAHDAGLAGTLVDNGSSATFTLKSKLEDGDKITIAGQEYTIGATSGDKSDALDGLVSVAKVSSTSAGDPGTKTVKAGDSIYDADKDKTYTLVNKMAAADVATGATGNFALTSEKSAFTVTHEDGSVSEYEVDDAGGAGKISAIDAQHLIDQELAAGSTVTMTKDKDGNAIANGGIEVVSALTSNAKEAEVSIAATAFTDPAKPTQAQFITAATISGGIAAGDKVTVGGETTTVTAQTPKSMEDINSVIGNLKATDKVEITRVAADGTSTSATLTIADETNELADQYSVADAQKMIQDGDTVKITKVVATNVPLDTALAKADMTSGASYTAVGATAGSDKTTITKADALDKIANELKAASSIGADAGKEASVVNHKDGSFTISKASTTVKDSLSFNLHVGADADMTNKIGVTIDTMDTAGLGIKGLNVKDATGTAATYAIDAIEDAIKTVSSQRSALGAVQNRLEHTIKNVDNVVENTTSAESAIRDTDMATEMVKYSNNNILAQAGTSMLAQANQSNQSILSLLG